MFKILDENIEYLSQLTKDEADFIEHILSWTDEQRVAFAMAKRIFEDKQNADKPEAG
jgi:hypothetical protein